MRDSLDVSDQPAQSLAKERASLAMARGRFDVSEVDPRLLQANERTLLAWIRTGIALMTFGFVVARVGVWLRALSRVEVDHPPTGTASVGAIFVAVGALANAMATRRYLLARRAIRAGKDIGDDSFPAAFAIGVTALGALLGAYLLLQLR